MITTGTSLPGSCSVGDIFISTGTSPGWYVAYAANTWFYQAGVPTGTVLNWSTNTAPVGYLLCDGSAVSRAVYAALFGVISSTFGAGDGSTTFNLPNLKGRVVVGADSGQTEFDVLGETGGEKAHTLTTPEIPAHTHTQDAHTHTQNSFAPRIINSGTAGTVGVQGASAASNASASNSATTATNQNATATNQNTGGGGAHNNLQPYIILNAIIKT